MFTFVKAWSTAPVLTDVRDRESRARVGALLVAIACCAMVGLGVWLQSRIHMNHDVAWIGHSAKWLLEGQRFGLDIVDPNPPFAWWLMLPAAAMADLAPQGALIRAWCWLLAITAIVLTGVTLLRLARTSGRSEAAALFLGASAAIALLPHVDFGQREVLAFALMLPYALSVACRVTGGSAGTPAMPLLVGFCAGVGLCLKPYLAIVPVLVELLHAVLVRSVRQAIRIETVAIAATVAAYLSAIAIAAPDYLSVALPLVSATYWAYEGPEYLVNSRFHDAVLPAAYAIAIAVVTLSFGRLHLMLVALVAGYSASYWAQHKGFPYHAYPVLACSCMLLAFSIVRAVRSVLAMRWIARAWLRWIVVAMLLVIALPVLHEPFRVAMRWYERADRVQGEWGIVREEPAARLRSLGVQPTDLIYALSTHPHPGFPAANDLGVRWAGSAVAQFALPAIARRSEITDSRRLAAIDRAAAWQTATVIADLGKRRPRYVFVEARQRRLGLAYRKFDDIAFYARDPGFQRLWTCYEELAPGRYFRLFRRRNDCAAD